jgi:hypothetical protein
MLLLVTRITAKLSSHFYDFSVIFGEFYKIQKLNPRSIDSICIEAPRIFHHGPSKTLIFHPGGAGKITGGEPVAGPDRASD